MSSKERILNARVDSASLGYFYDGKILSARLVLSTHSKDANTQGWFFGDLAFDGPVDDTFKRVGSAFGMEFIARVLRTLDIDRWEDLPEVHLRIRVNTPTPGEERIVYAIGHYLEDNWFYPEELVKEMQ